MAILNEITHPVASDIFTAHGLDHFDAFWQLSAETVEQGNMARGGWSRVEKLSLTHQGATHVFYIKKQQNYSVRMPIYFFKKVPTLLKEKNMIDCFQVAHIPTMETAYFAWRKQGSNQQAILVTWELTHYLPLEKYFAKWSTMTFDQKRNITKSVAQVIHRMHQQYIMHNCLYPKHIFVKVDGEHVKTALIDLEKAKRVPWRSIAFKRDLDSLNRRSVNINFKTKLFFMHDYMSERKLSGKGRDKLYQLFSLARKG